MPSRPTGAGWRDLAVVRERGARAVVGWTMADHRRADLVTQAWALAPGQRPPAAGRLRPPERGRPSGADRARQLRAPHGRPPRMSRQATGGETAGAERVVHTCKTAWLSREDVAPHAPAQRGVVAYLEGFEHRQRGHAAHGDLAPRAAEQALNTHGMLCPETC
jgi:putative transposase